MAQAGMAEWFEDNPQALDFVRCWLEQRAAGECDFGSPAMVATLQAEHDFPFKDYTSLAHYARSSFPALYGNAKPVRKRLAPKPVAPTFKRSDADVRRLERRQDFFVTSAVQESAADEGFLKAVLRWREERDGIIVINPVNYVNPRTRKEERSAEERREKWWDPALKEFMLTNELRPHPDVSIMATKAQATASNPLPGRLSGRTKHRSAVFGHPQLCMRTVATPQAKYPKILYSSGAITEKFYSETLSGDMAEFHHSLGGVIVEIRGDRFHMREVTWDGKSFIDIDRRYSATGITDAPPPEALVMGDVHAPHFVAENVMEAVFGEGGIYEATRPRRLVLHDLADNRCVNPHEALNKLTRAALAGQGNTNLDTELGGVADWLAGLPKFEEILVSYSNHDDFLARWLQRANPEPHNAKLFHYLSYLMLQHHEDNGEFPIALELALRELFELPESIRFLGVDESYSLKGVELAMHGHHGPNGARGSLKSLSPIGTRFMIGHTHSPGIWQGGYGVGLSSDYRQGYNVGPSSWLHSQGLLHANGYRQLLHCIGTHYRG